MNRLWFQRLFCVLAFLTLIPRGSAALLHDHSGPGTGHGSITNRQIEWPDRADFMRVIFLKDYNTRLVVVSASLLGTACGLIGGFLLLR